MASGWNLNLSSQGRGRGRGRCKDTGGGDKVAAPGNPGLKGSNDNALAEKRFQEISRGIQDSVQHHLEQTADNNDDLDSSSEEDVDDETILNSMYKNYSIEIESDMGIGDLDHSKQSMQEACRTGGNVCAICIGKIRLVDAVWSCDECSGILHLHCIQNWSKQAIMLQNLHAEEKVPRELATWSCPNCRFEYRAHQTPTRYTCFCGKLTNPPQHPWLAPHSCGERCDRTLKPSCGHSCLLLCHPGPCPPCPQMVKSSCHCGSQAAQPRRCCSKDWSCGNPCNSLLSCLHHRCSTPCHKGECSPCPRSSNQKCVCGKNSVVRPCAEPTWTCEEPCGRNLSCGKHTCEMICHEGSCGDCPRSGVRKCPCGKTEFTRPCTEDIPVCGDTCEKLLQCGTHKCTRACHYGSCEKCLQMSVKRCRCGQREKAVPCTKEFLCDTKCNNMKPCSRHSCKRRCCDGNCLPCDNICGRTLNCKNHKCASQCHPGLCYPCPQTVDITCFCHKTKINVRCGVERVTKPPKCKKPCTIPPDCHHEKRDVHRCHFKRCPPCAQVCGMTLARCSHICPYRCHSAVLTKEIPKTVRTGPWDPVPQPVVRVVKYPCPPCGVPVPVQCLGKHTVEDRACSAASAFQCPSLCKRTLRCTNHTCQLECHAVSRTTAEGLAGPKCQSCEEPCLKPRPQGCTHTCPLPCHPEKCPTCTSSIKMRCHCKNMQLYIECSKWTSSTDWDRETLTSCHGPCPKLLSCGHTCGNTCHAGDCTSPEDCTKKKPIRCPCRRRKKEYACCDINSGKITLDCDSVCQQVKDKNREKQKEEERLAEEEKKRKEERDLAVYERLMHGKKRKPRKRREEIQEKTFLQKYWKSMATVAAVIITVVGLLSIAIYG